MGMSIYGHIKQAYDSLKLGYFTELDVVAQALQDDWGPAEHKKALVDANRFLSARYRAGELVRFGPIEVDGAPDYVRQAGKIVYSDRPVAIRTPNGDVSALRYADDQIGHAGRRAGTNRDDLYPDKNKSAEDRISELEEELAQAFKRIRSLERERRDNEEREADVAYRR